MHDCPDLSVPAHTTPSYPSILSALASTSSKVTCQSSSHVDLQSSMQAIHPLTTPTLSVPRYPNSYPSSIHFLLLLLTMFQALIKAEMPCLTRGYASHLNCRQSACLGILLILLVFPQHITKPLPLLIVVSSTPNQAETLIYTRYTAQKPIKETEHSSNKDKLRNRHLGI